MPGIVLDTLTFFGEQISVADALLATTIYEDQVIIDVAQTDRILKSIVSQKKDLLVDFCKREVIAREFEHALPECDNSGQVEYFTVRDLLSFVPTEEVEAVGLIDVHFPEKLADFIVQHHPEVASAVKVVMTQYHNRETHFPLKQKN